MVQRGGTIFAAASALPQRARTQSVAPDPLPELISESTTPLYVLQTVFPFVLFTDKVIIRTNHVDVIRGVFFWSAVSTRVQITDIRQVSIEFNPFFATLDIIPQGPLEQTLSVAYLWKSQAKKARRIIAGLMESHQNRVDFAKYNRPTLVRSIEELGKARE